MEYKWEDAAVETKKRNTRDDFYGRKTMELITGGVFTENSKICFVCFCC